MIAFLTGRLAEKTATHAVLDVAGVGYLLAMPSGSLSALPAEGDTVTVYTHLHVREDEMSLFGFESREERRLFELLITVSGVGPKVALAALSSLPVDVLVAAIVSEDIATISSVPGVGKKTAQRMVLDLKDKLAAGTVAGGPATGVAASDVTADAREALLQMGFSSTEIISALSGFEGPGDTQAVLRHALKRLGGGA